MSGVKGKSGREAKFWTKVFRRKDRGAMVLIPWRQLEEAGVPRDAELVVRRTAYRQRKAVILEFREASRVSEAERA